MAKFSQTVQEQIFGYINYLIHWNSDKMTLWGKHYLKPFPKTASQIYKKSQICPKHNLGKPINNSVGHFFPAI